MIDRSYDPYEYRDRDDRLCRKPDCDEYKIDGAVGHALSTFPYDYPLPMSTGSDHIAGSQFLYAYRAWVDSKYLNEECTLFIDACLKSSHHRGNTANAGGALKYGSPGNLQGEIDPARPDACFALTPEEGRKSMDPRWQPVLDEGDDPNRVQHVRLALTLGGSSGTMEFPKELEDIVLDNYDSRTDFCLMVNLVVELSEDSDDDEDGPPGDYYDRNEGGDGQPGPDDEGDRLSNQFRPLPVGRYGPTNSDDDALWDRWELICQGIDANDSNDALNYDTGFRYVFYDDENEGHYPDPLDGYTVGETPDHWQDSELSFMEVVNPSAMPAQTSKGNGRNAVGDQGGLVIARSPVDERSGVPRPMRLNEIAKLQHENAAFPVGPQIGAAKIHYMSFADEELKNMMAPQLEDDSIKMTIAENLGVIPVEVRPEYTFPHKDDRHYKFLIEELLRVLENKDRDASVPFDIFTIFGGSYNFNSGPRYVHPYLDGPDGEDLQLEPTFSPVSYHQFYEAGTLPPNPGHGAESSHALAQAFGTRGRKLQLTDFVFFIDGREVACGSWPIIYYKDSLQAREDLYYECFGEFGRSYVEEKLDYSFLGTFLHELTHVLPRQNYHPYETLKYSKELSVKNDIAYETEFDPTETNGVYYRLKEANQPMVGHWTLVETLKEIPVMIEHFVFSIHSSQKNYLHNMHGTLYVQKEGGQQGTRGSRAGLVKARMYVPNLYVDAKRQVLPRGRYWLFESFFLKSSSNIPLYRKAQVATQQMGCGGQIFQKRSVLEPENAKQDPAIYKQVDLQRFEDPQLGYLRIDVGD